VQVDIRSNPGGYCGSQQATLGFLIPTGSNIVEVATDSFAHCRIISLLRIHFPEAQRYPGILLSSKSFQ
jgi:hypothetical protein